MTDLDQPIETALLRRSDQVASASLSPAAVHRAVRRQRLALARRTAAGALLAAGAVAVAASHLHVHTDVAPTRPAPKPTQSTDPQTLASVPWAGDVPLTLVRFAGAGGYALCIGGSQCFPTAAAGAGSIVMGADNAMYGLAPKGTTTVKVTISGEPTATAVTAPSMSSASGTSGGGVLFALSGVSATYPQGTAFSRSYTVTASDAAGRLLARASAVGGADLALAHPPTGRVLDLYSDGPVDPTAVAWSDAAGWACWGQRTPDGTPVSYGAYACVPPTDRRALAPVGLDPGHNAAVLRTPPGVVTVQLRSPAGVITESKVSVVGRVRLGYLRLWPARGTTIVGLSSAGKVLSSVAVEDLQVVPGTVNTQPS